MKLTLTQRLSQKAFKMTIILSIKDLSPNERNRKINELVEKEFEIPYSTKKYLSRSTIYAWLKKYEETEDRDTALLRKERSDNGKWRKLTDIQKKALTRWRYDNAYRTCEELLEELLENQLADLDNAPSLSVIRRFFRESALDRKTLTRRQLPSGKIRLKYEADYPNQIWMIDTKGPNIKIPSTHDPLQLISVMPIVVIDDYSRFIVGIRYIYMGEENEEMVMSVLMEAFDKYGIPDILYGDRGSPYMGKSLEKALTVLGCKIMHTRPRDPAAKGKCEKIMQLYYAKVDTELTAKKQCETVNIEIVNEYAAAITHFYHQTKHRETDELPCDRYLSHPGKFRHYASKEILSLLFLPLARSRVTKDNLILLNKRKYLIPIIGYDKKFVEVRSKVGSPESVYIWFENKFLGIAEEYISQNDFLERKRYLDQQIPAPVIEIPDVSEVPEYNRLDRKLLEYRTIKENEVFINDELLRLQKQRADTKTQLTYSKNTITIPLTATATAIPAQMSTPSDSSSNPLIKQQATAETNLLQSNIEEWRADQCVHLFSSLFKRLLSAQERFAIHRTFHQYGPFKEKMVRSVVGRLLGESHPTSDLSGYLDAIRIASMIKMEENDNAKND